MSIPWGGRFGAVVVLLVTLLWASAARAQACNADPLSGFTCEPLPFRPLDPEGLPYPDVEGEDGSDMHWTDTSPGGEVARLLWAQFKANTPHSGQTSSTFGGSQVWSTQATAFGIAWTLQWQLSVLALPLSGVAPTLPPAAPSTIPQSTAPHFAGAAAQLPLPTAPPDGSDPVDLATGEMIYEATDLAFPGFGVTFAHRRTYRSRLRFQGAHGHAWDHVYDQRLTTCPDKPLVSWCRRWLTGKGASIDFISDPSAAAFPAQPGTDDGDLLFTYIATGARRYTLTGWTTTAGTFRWYLLDLATGEVRRFDRTGDLQPRTVLTRWQDRHGMGLALEWEESLSLVAMQLVRVRDAAGRVVEYDYDAAGRLEQISEATSGLWASYEYDALGNLYQATDQAGRTETFSYRTATAVPPGATEWNVREACEETCKPGGTACFIAAQEARAQCETEATAVCTTDCRAGCQAVSASAEVGAACLTASGGCRDACSAECTPAQGLDECREYIEGNDPYDDNACEVDCENTCRNTCTRYFPDERQIVRCLGCCLEGDGFACFLDSCNAGVGCRTACEQAFAFGSEQSLFYSRCGLPSAELGRGCVWEYPNACKATCEPSCVNRCRTSSELQCNLTCPGQCSNAAAIECSAVNFAAACPAACNEACLAGARANGPIYGNQGDLDRNLLTVGDGNGHVFLENRYGEDPSKPSFDAVTWQRFGDAEIEYHWRDLRGEEDGVIVPPTEPQTLLVDDWRTFSLTPRCPGRLVFKPARAVVVRDAFGSFRTLYFDATGRMVRETNHATTATVRHEYNVFGEHAGTVGPQGEAICVDWAGPGAVGEIARYPKATSTEAPIRTKATYMPGSFFPKPTHLFAAHRSDLFANVTTLGWTGNVIYTVRTPTGETVGMTPTPEGAPHRVTGVDGTVTRYEYDARSGAPKRMHEDADGPAPRVTTWDFEPAGRLIRLLTPLGEQKTWTYAAGLLIQEEQRANGGVRSRLYGYDDAGQVTEVLERQNGIALRSLSMTYDDAGQLRRRIERASNGSLPERMSCFRHGNDGRLLEDVRPDGVRRRHLHDGEGRLVIVEQGAWANGPLGAWDHGCPSAQVASAPVVIERRNYDLSGALIRHEQFGIVTEIVPDAFGRPQRVKLPTGGIAIRGFDDEDRILWEAVWDPAHVQETKPTGAQTGLLSMTERGYDASGRLTSETSWVVPGSVGLTTTRIPNLAARTETVTTPLGTTQRTWDRLGRTTEVRLPSGDLVSTSYSPDGRTINTEWTAPTPTGRQRRKVLLDQLGETQRVEDPDRGTTALYTATRDESGHLTSEMAAGSSMRLLTYDPFGRVSQEIDRSRDELIEYVWDSADRVRFVRSMIDPAVVNTGGSSSSASMQSMSMTGGGATTEAACDPNVDPDCQPGPCDGIWCPDPCETYGIGCPDPTPPPPRIAVTEILHDNLDRETFRYLPGGQVRQLQYRDVRREPWKLILPSGKVLRHERDVAGQLLDLFAEGTPSSRHFRYDPLGRLRGHSQDGAVVPVLATWDVAGRLTRDESLHVTPGVVTETYSVADALNPSGPRLYEWTAARDALGRTTSLVDAATQAPITQFSYQGLGGPLTRNDSPENIATTYRYDGMGRLVGARHAQGTATLSDLSWRMVPGGDRPSVQIETYGTTTRWSGVLTTLFGRVTLEAHGLPGAPPSTTATASQVDSAISSGKSSAQDWREYSHDERANWKEFRRASETYAPTIGIGDDYTYFGSQQVFRDGDQNVTGIGSETYAWNAFGELKEAHVGSAHRSFGYDALGRLVRSTDLTTGVVTTYGWAGQQRLTRKVGTGPTEVLVPGPQDDEVLYIVSGATKRFLHQDPSRSVYQVTQNGAISERYRYTAFGEPTVLAPNGTPRIGTAPSSWILYQGHTQDPAVGLVSMRARFYRPAWGHFLSSDQLDLDADTNRFGFVSSSPLSFRDPLGLKSEPHSQPNYAVGDVVMSSLGPSFYAHALRTPSDIISNGTNRGAPAVLRQASRIGWRAQNAMRHVDFWGNTVASVLGGVVESVGAPLVARLLARSVVPYVIRQQVGQLAPLVARGGLAPVRQGAEGVKRAIADLEAAGGRLLGREITIEAGGVRTRPDLFVELPNGRPAFLEIKTGASADLSPNQRVAFPQIRMQGGIPRGGNAAAAGLTPGLPMGPTPIWTVYYPWPLP